VGAISGIDWASDWHDVHVSDEHGSVLTIERFAHDEHGINALVELLVSHQVVFTSMFRDPKSTITAAGLLAEIGDNRARYPTSDTLAADAGQSPVTIQSGKHRAATFRWACDKRLRNHINVLADSTRHWHPWAHDTYQRARARGCDHPHAIRILGRAWTRALWACWQNHTPYNPTQHRALNKLLTQQG
jgi:transposase